MSSQHVLSWPITMCISACCLISSSTDAAGPGTGWLTGSLDELNQLIRPLSEPSGDFDEEACEDVCEGWTSVLSPVKYGFKLIPNETNTGERWLYQDLDCSGEWLSDVPIKTRQYVTTQSVPYSNVRSLSEIETGCWALDCEEAYMAIGNLNGGPGYAQVTANVHGRDQRLGQWTLSPCPGKPAKAWFEAEVLFRIKRS